MYNFIDVNEASEIVALPSEALRINGEYIENQISGYRTLNVSGREALSPEVETYSTGVRDGSKLKNRRYPERTIIVTYQLRAESNEAFRAAYNKLGRILDVEDAELIFNDEQDKFFVGTPCAIGAVPPGRNSVVGEIEIRCADPFKYSTVEYTAEAELDTKSVLIDYNGTYKAYPTLVAEFLKEDTAKPTGRGDCGYVAFFTEDEKIIQIGSPDEAEGESYEKSQTLINSVFNSNEDWGESAQSQWAVNSGITSSDAVQQAGTPGIGVASYAVNANAASTSGTLLAATSTAEVPWVKYNVTAKASNRTANSVKVTVSIKAALGRETEYWTNRGVLIASVYIGGKWNDVTLKAATDQWKGLTGHTKNVTVTVTGLSESTSSLTGIKFKAYRNDGLGKTGVLAETNCKNLAITKYVTSTPETYYLTASDFGTGSDWHGPSITGTIPEDGAGQVGAKNFVLTYSQKMSIGDASDATNQFGAFQVLLVSGSGTSRNVVAGVNVYKGTSGKTAKLRFYVNNKVVQTTDIDLSYNNQYFKSSKTSTIRKSGYNVIFNICGIEKTFKDTAITETMVNEVTFTITKFGSRTPLSYNGLYWAKFVKDNCDEWKNVPNKFGANDVVEADCREGIILFNGVSTPGLGALGNDWEGFYLTPGLNQLGFACSDWVPDEHAPTMKVRYREVFL